MTVMRRFMPTELLLIVWKPSLYVYSGRDFQPVDYEGDA